MLPVKRALALLALAASPLLAELAPRGTTVTVAHDPVLDVGLLATAVQDDGSFLIVWSRRDQPNLPSDWQLFAQVFDADGRPRAAARDLMRGVITARAAALPGGGYLLAWERGGLGAGGVRARLLDSLAAPVGEPFALDDTGGPDILEYYERVAVAADRFAAIWAHVVFHTQADGTLSVDKQFRLRLFGLDGTPRGPSVEMNPLAQVSNGDGGFADIAAVPGGGFCTVWSWELQPGATASIRARRWDADGSPTTAALHLDTAGVQGYAYSSFPRAVAHPDGSCTLAWVSLDEVSTYTKHIHVVRLDGNGEVGQEHLAPPTDTDYGFGFDLAADRRGGVLMLDVTGYGHPFSPYPPGMLRRLDVEGLPIGAPIEAIPGGFFGGVALGANAAGDIVVAWSGNGSGTYPDRHDVLAQRFQLGCSPGGSELCLGEGSRFTVRATWRTPAGETGTATAIPVTSDTGGFWFFSAANLELLVKVLDGRAVNGHFWVLWGGLTNLDVQLTVTDNQNGATRAYSNPAGEYPGRADVEAFADDGSGEAAATTAGAAALAPQPSVSTASGSCASGPMSLCLGGRYLVEVIWHDPAGWQGDAHPLPASADAGFLWFFSADNLELAVKVLDGTAVNGHRWVFVAGLTDVEYTLTVTDTESGAVRSYHNPPRTLRSFADTAAF